MFRFRITSNLDEFQRKLQRIKENVAALNGPRQVKADELFNTSFMVSHTNFSTLDEMLQRSGFQVQSVADFEQISDDDRNKFIAAHTQFSSWQDMFSTAQQEYYTQKLNEALGS